MPLDPTARAVLDAMARSPGPSLATATPEQLRAFRARGAALLPKGPEVLVEERALPRAAGGLGARFYRPLDSAGQRLPLVVFFHGGGFVTGDLTQADGDCRRLASGVGCMVASVDYPLAPEHKFPEPLEACYRVSAYLHEHAAELEADPQRIAVAGDSAGANLATGVAMLARDRGGPPIVAQVLYYPICDLSNFDNVSYRENAEGYFLTLEGMQWFAHHYLRSDDDARDPRASPLLSENLSRLPSALIVTAEYDPLRDEAESYAAKLAAAGTRVECLRYDGMIHGFVTMAGYFEAGMRATEAAVRSLRAAFG